ncbi:MAG: tRNA (adenosine(37)-N6)-threonylcarbamoyltransferase complex transferase subunit TsaD [bacterium]
MKILAIESSCDDTSVSIVENGKVLSNVISSQHFHSKYGGVIPELASRAHLSYIYEVLTQSLKESQVKISDIDAIAVTTEPGLIGSLLVGSNFGKGLAIKYNKPIIPVNHIEGHIYSGSLQDSNVEFPYITLVVSGGHTALFYVESFSKYNILGATVDDAAGEAFDKIASMLGLPYPGGPEIDRIAMNGNPKKYNFPRSMINDHNFNFSFSGLKTSVKYFLEKEFQNNNFTTEIPDIAASLQQAIVDVLVKKTIDAAFEMNVNAIIIAGGVSANSLLREQMKSHAAKHNIQVVAPDLQYCMDNAAMVGFLAEKKLQESGIASFLNLTFRVNASSIRAKKVKRNK